MSTQQRSLACILLLALVCNLAGAQAYANDANSVERLKSVAAKSDYEKKQRQIQENLKSEQEIARANLPEERAKQEILKDYLKRYEETKQQLHRDLLNTYKREAFEYWRTLEDVVIKYGFDEKSMEEVRSYLAKLSPDRRYVYDYIYYRYVFTNNKVDQKLKVLGGIRDQSGKLFGLFAVMGLLANWARFETGKTDATVFTWIFGAGAVLLGTSFVAKSGSDFTESNIRARVDLAMQQSLDNQLNLMTSKIMSNMYGK